MEKESKEALQKVIEKTRWAEFLPEYRNEVSEARVLGIVVSKYLEWNGDAILEAAASALEDANFHGEAQKVRDMRDTLL